jgi:hypothetical protein
MNIFTIDDYAKQFTKINNFDYFHFGENNPYTHNNELD